MPMSPGWSHSQIDHLSGTRAVSSDSAVTEKMTGSGIQDLSVSGILQILSNLGSTSQIRFYNKHLNGKPMISSGVLEIS
jgi:hypothetical protein